MKFIKGIQYLWNLADSVQYTEMVKDPCQWLTRNLSGSILNAVPEDLILKGCGRVDGEKGLNRLEDASVVKLQGVLCI